jgi:hypothetical protein
MKISELLKENSSAGGTSAGSIATNMTPNGTPPNGQFFGGDPSSSIYNTIKKNRKNRRKSVIVGKTVENWKNGSK